MHRLAHFFVAAEGEGEVGDTARDMGVRTGGANLSRGLDKGLAIFVMLFQAGGDGEDVGIENNVFRREADSVHQDVIGALADFQLAFAGIGLADLIERHHHHGGAEAQAFAGALDELRLAFLHADGIDDRLALAAFQPRLDHRPFGTVDHQRHFGNVRLARDHVDIAGHRRFGIDQPLVHVDVDDLGAVLHLLPRHIQRRLIVIGGDQLAELGRAGDVGALADIDEIQVRRQGERLQSRQPHIFGLLRNLARRHILDGLAERLDMLRLGAAAAADDVDQAGAGEFPDHFGHGFGRLVIAAEFVGQAGIGMG